MRRKGEYGIPNTGFSLVLFYVHNYSWQRFLYVDIILVYDICLEFKWKYLFQTVDLNMLHLLSPGKGIRADFQDRIGSEISGLKIFQYRIGSDPSLKKCDRIGSPIWKVNIGSDRCSDVIGSDLHGFFLCWNIYWKFSWIILRWLKVIKGQVRTFFAILVLERY